MLLTNITYPTYCRLVVAYYVVARWSAAALRMEPLRSTILAEGLSPLRASDALFADRRPRPWTELLPQGRVASLGFNFGWSAE